MLRIVLVILLSLGASSAMAKKYGYLELDRHTQRPGGDYSYFNSKNAKRCARECADDPRCQAFDFHKSDRTCWLKDRIPPAIENRSVVSGVKERHNQWGYNDVIAGMQLDYGKDRLGSDYTHFTIKNVRECARECANDPRCRAFGFDKRDRSCWLKDRVPPLRQKSYVISGVKERGGHGYGGNDYNLPREIVGLRIYNNNKRYGNDYNIFTVDSVEECARACSYDDRCQSFSYGKQRRDCWLKDRIPKGFADHLTISGVKEHGGRDIPGWAIGNFHGRNRRDRTDAYISISPDGNVTAVWGGRQHKGYFENGVIHLGKLDFIVKWRQDGLETILRSDRGNRVHFRRKH
ncbi:MAG TPA: hypothetical protein EYG88_06120 [Desulfocapsa sulfexigens]|nr:hypothetical protein [Desulfocapsa sulfexigens]